MQIDFFYLRLSGVYHCYYLAIKIVEVQQFENYLIFSAKVGTRYDK